MSFENDFTKLANSSIKKIYNYILKLVGNVQDAEDITQDVYKAAYSKLDKVNKAARLAYLFKTAYHKAIDFRKKNKRMIYVDINQNNIQDKSINLQQEELTKQKNKIIFKAMQNLNTNEATVIELKFYQNLSYLQISQILNISPKAVDSLLIRAKRKLKKYISQDLPNIDVLSYKSKGDKNEKQN